MQYETRCPTTSTCVFFLDGSDQRQRLLSWLDVVVTVNYCCRLTLMFDLFCAERCLKWKLHEQLKPTNDRFDCCISAVFVGGHVSDAVLLALIYRTNKPRVQEYCSWFASRTQWHKIKVFWGRSGTSRLLAPRVSLSEQVRTVSDSELVGRHVAFWNL